MKVREGARRGREGKGSRRGLWRTLPVPAGSRARPPQLCHSRRLTMSSLGTCPWPPGRRLQPAGSEACLLSRRRWGYTLAFRKHTPLLQSGASFSARASWDTCVPTRISLGHPRRSSSLGPSVPRMSRDIFDRHDQDGAIPSSFRGWSPRMLLSALQCPGQGTVLHDKELSGRGRQQCRD